jgi:glycosyltransferase involved in cell wall biosynthesis
MKRLRIAVVSNHYPPHYIGGYELGCRDVVNGLQARGHEVKVLTSTYNVDGPEDDGEVYRWLVSLPPWEPVSSGGFFRLLRREIINRRSLTRLCRTFSPDLIYVWNPAGISLSFVFSSQPTNVPVCYFVSDHWLSEWESDFGYGMWSYRHPRRARRVVWKTLLPLLDASKVLRRPRPPDFRRVHFASRFLKDAALAKGKPVACAKVIHWGVNVELAPYQTESQNPLRLLYVGQVAPHKGVHTVIEALRRLVREHGYEAATLTIAGGSVNPDYEQQVRRLVSSSGLERSVRFTGQLPREQLLSLYRHHAILVFPSVWNEPFSITVLEAMSSGLAVVGTPTGGSLEILRDGENALVFPKEDSRQCAAQILRLWTEPGLLEKIRVEARLTIESEFRFEQMVDSIEQSLQEVAAGAGWCECPGVV